MAPWAQVSDFGLSTKRQRAACGGKARFGTPAFMAPEIIAHGAMALSPASDVYAFGIMLHEVRPCVRVRVRVRVRADRAAVPRPGML